MEATWQASTHKEKNSHVMFVKDINIEWQPLKSLSRTSEVIKIVIEVTSQ